VGSVLVDDDQAAAYRSEQIGIVELPQVGEPGAPGFHRDRGLASPARSRRGVVRCHTLPCGPQLRRADGVRGVRHKPQPGGGRIRTSLLSSPERHLGVVVSHQIPE
jgi:hypothetical protein